MGRHFKPFIQFVWATLMIARGASIIGPIFIIGGLSFPEVMRRLELPQYASIWWVPWVFVFLGLWLVAYAFFLKSAFDAGDDERLKRLKFKSIVTFNEISTTIAKSKPAYTADDAMHQLLRAFWRGDFERRSYSRQFRRHEGRMVPRLDTPQYRSDLFILTTESGVRGDRPLKGQSTDAQGRHVTRDVDPNPPQTPFGRLTLLTGCDMGLHGLYPRLQHVAAVLKDVPWHDGKKIVNFPLLESARPSDYAADFRSAYLEPMAMHRKTFLRWYRDFRLGRYENNA